jgi:hypothetical protein
MTNERKPELSFGKGPVVEILINVARALSKHAILHGVDLKRPER